MFRSRLVLILALLAAVPAAAEEAAETYVFGIVPQQSGSRLSRLWSPILAWLEERSGLRLRFATTRNIPTFERRLAQGKYDFAYMNPYHYIQFHERSGYTAFARARDKRLKGILVVRRDSPFRRLADLDEQDLAFPSNAFAANLVPRAVFRQEGIDVEAHFVSSHDSVYRNVAKGRYPAGGGVMRTFRNTPAAYRKQLRVLWTSEGYTPHAFAAHPRVPPEAVERLQAAMLAMDRDPRGRALLKRIRLKGIEAGSDPDWNDVRELAIND